MENCRGFIFVSAEDDEGGESSGAGSASPPERTGRGQVPGGGGVSRTGSLYEHIRRSAMTAPSQLGSYASFLANNYVVGRESSSEWPNHPWQVPEDGRLSPGEIENPGLEPTQAVPGERRGSANGLSAIAQEYADFRGTPTSNETGGAGGEPGLSEQASTRIEDNVLNVIRELRSQYIYQYRPGLQLDVNEQFGTTNNPPVTTVRPLLEAVGRHPMGYRNWAGSSQDVADEAVFVPRQFQFPGPSTTGLPQSSGDGAYGVASAENAAEIAQLRAIGTVTDGLWKRLTLLQRALSVQIDTNIDELRYVATQEGQGQEARQASEAQTTTGTGQRPATNESGNTALDYNEWDDHSNMTHFTQTLFNAESDSSEEEGMATGRADYGSLNALRAFYQGAMREAGTSTTSDSLERARARARRPAFQLPRNVSPDTREFYLSIGLGGGEEVGPNAMKDFVIMPNPRKDFPDVQKLLLGKYSPTSLYDYEENVEEDKSEPEYIESDSEDAAVDFDQWNQKNSDAENLEEPEPGSPRDDLYSGVGQQYLPSYISGLRSCLPKVELDQEDEDLHKFLEAQRTRNYEEEDFGLRIVDYMCEPGQQNPGQNIGSATEGAQRRGSAESIESAGASRAQPGRAATSVDVNERNGPGPKPKGASGRKVLRTKMPLSLIGPKKGPAFGKK